MSAPDTAHSEPPPATEPPTSAAGRGATGVALAIFGGTAGLALALDQIAKYLAVAHLTGHPPVKLLGGAVYLVLTRNSGAAFSMATDYTFVFPLITIVVAGWIGWMARTVRSVPWAVSLGLVLGGALGNLTDRLFRAPGPFVGHVVDFVSVFADQGQRFPVFNVADMALTCGVVLAIWLELTGRHRNGTRVRDR